MREWHVCLDANSSCAYVVSRLGTGRTFPLTLYPVLQASGGAAGDDAAERVGQWPLPVSALRGGLGLPGQRLCVLQRLQEGKPRSSLADQISSPAQVGFAAPWLCFPPVLHMCICMFLHVVISFAFWQEEWMVWLLEIALRRVRAGYESRSHSSHQTSENWSGISCLVFSIWKIGAIITCTPVN